MKLDVPRARASFTALLLALAAGCSSGAVPAQQAETAPPATQTPPAQTAEAHAHEHDAPPAQPAPVPSAVPQASAAPAAQSPELAAYQRAKPILEKYCASCHTKDGQFSTPKALEHFAMDGYPFGGHHAHEAGAIVRKSLGAAGTKATMPRGKPGSVQGDDLAAILAWADAFDAAHPPAAKDAGGHSHAPHKH